MQNISRGDFLKLGAAGVAATLVPSRLWGLDTGAEGTLDDAFLQKLIEHNDLAVDRYLNPAGRSPRPLYYRSLSEEFATHTGSYCQPKSRHYRSATLLSRMNAILEILVQAQYPNGTLDSGGNRQSPPDTAFLTDHLCPASTVLNNDAAHDLEPLKRKLTAFLVNIGEGLKTGGVHTPNHRWEVSAALARIFTLHGDEGCIRRLDEWLAEGIDINADGNYSERSRTYAVVVNNSLLTIGRLLNRPSLFIPVRKSLETTFYYEEANGDLVALDSRRQDQYLSLSILSSYLFYRFLAIHDGDENLAAIARHIETLPNFDRAVLSRSLIFCMDNPLLLQELRTGTPLETTYTNLYPLSGLARFRRGTTTASIFGANDKPVIIASGRSTNPTFFAFRKGSAILEYVRMSTSFFNTGYFRSDGLQKDGNRYLLHEKKEAFYYQPLPPGKRDSTGSYALTESLDGRFWNSMDFPSRPTTSLTLDAAVTIEEVNGIFTVHFTVDGPKDVEVSIECCFRSGGKLEGAVAGTEADDYFLKEGTATYTTGTDVIEIGPGRQEHTNIRMLDGEEYLSHFGTVKGKGMHVYMTGLVPLRYSMTIK